MTRSCICHSVDCTSPSESLLKEKVNPNSRYLRAAPLRTLPGERPLHAHHLRVAVGHIGNVGERDVGRHLLFQGEARLRIAFHSGSVGSMRNWLTPKKRCRRPVTGLASAWPAAPKRPSAATIARRALLRQSRGSDVGLRPVASSATISLNCSGGPNARQIGLGEGPETFSVTSMPFALVSRSISKIGSIRTGLKNCTVPWVTVYLVRRRSVALRDVDAPVRRDC